ncbi:MAG: ABC transporter substrate-binding protein [Anaerolineae bacterium]|nr:ABC transporter substrate-binding protein [Anaerolineae bacterium]
MFDKKVSRRDLLKGVAVGAGGVLASAALPQITAAQDATAEPAPTSTLEPMEPTGEPIRVVGIFPLSGFIAADGEEMRNGLVMAIDEINEMGGLLGSPLEYIEIDDVDSFTPEEVSTAFERAVEVENPDVIISGYHLLSSPEFDIVANAERLYYNVNTQQAWIDLYKSDPAKYWGIFQCDPAEIWYGGGFAFWLEQMVAEGKYELPAGKTAAILAESSTYGTVIANSFEEAITNMGWEVTAKESFLGGSVSDWGTLLSSVRDNPPSVLFSSDYNPADGAALAQQLAADPMPTLVYMQYGPSVPEFLELAGEAANGVIWATVLGLLSDKIGDDFRARYEAKFGQAPGWANAGGVYDTTWVWAKSVALAGDAKNYRRVAAMTERLIHRGTTGSISFENHAGLAYPGQTSDPSLGQPHIIVQIQNGEHKIISPEPYTTSDFQLPPWFA